MSSVDQIVGQLAVRAELLDRDALRQVERVRKAEQRAGRRTSLARQLVEMGCCDRDRARELVARARELDAQLAEVSPDARDAMLARLLDDQPRATPARASAADRKRRRRGASPSQASTVPAPNVLDDQRAITREALAILISGGYLTPSQVEKVTPRVTSGELVGVDQLAQTLAIDAELLTLAQRMAGRFPRPGSTTGSEERGGPSHLAGYKLGRVLGRGAMGVVYEATDEKLRRRVALKVLRSSLGERGAQRLRREAQLTARIKHPGVVGVHEVGEAFDLESQQSVQFIAMDLVGGGTLVDKLGTPELAPKVELVRQVCEAMAAAHAASIVHRDLKPANVLISEDGRAIVSDFGLARAADQLTQLTRTGAALGTLTHMSPEQIDADADKVGPASDVWALGVILYQALTGGLPFWTSGGAAALTYAILAADPEPPRSSDPSIPADLDAVCLRCLAKRPELRYSDAGEVEAELARWQRDEPTLARPATSAGRLLRFCRRHARALGSAAAVIGALIAALTYGVITARREAQLVRQQRAEVEAALTQVTEEKRKAEASEREARASQQRAAESRRRALESAREAERNLAKAKRLGALRTVSVLQRQAERELDWTPLARVGDALRGDLAQPPTRARLLEVGRQIEDWRAAAAQLLARRQRFVAELNALPEADQAGSPEERDWLALQRESYVQILQGLRALDAAFAELGKRREALGQKHRRPQGVVAWKALIQRLRRNRRYRLGLSPGRRVAFLPQVDLVPIGPDPDSGLEEFAHLGSGEPVTRGADGRLRWSERSGIVFVLMPAGSYEIGSVNFPGAAPSGPVHQVTLDAFFIGKTELTQAQWETMGGSNNSAWRAGKTFGELRISGRHPVERVSWRECVELLARHGLELPTERQWEVAARGGTTTPWWTGSDPRSLATAENLGDARAKRYITSLGRVEAWEDAHVITAPAGSIRPAAPPRGPGPHPYGLHDILGNVREWCRDVYEENYTRAEQLDRSGWIPPNEPQLELRTRSDRGAGWTDPAVGARAAYRGTSAPDFRSLALGCRPSRRAVLRVMPAKD